MADSAQDPKVEDVLSSVRRLVSQEIPKRQAPKPGVEDGALVLTSKDRIKADHTARVAARSLEQRIAELEAAVDSRAQEFEPDGSEDQSQHRPDRIVFTRPRSSETEAREARSSLRLSEISVSAPAPDAEPEDDESGDVPVEFRRGTTKPAPEAPMAEDVPTLPASSADLHAFSDPDDVVARIEARIERGGEPPEETPVAEVEAAEDDFDADLTAAVRASLARQTEEPGEMEAADTFILKETFADPAPAPEAPAAETDSEAEARVEPGAEVADVAPAVSDEDNAPDTHISEPVSEPPVEDMAAASPEPVATGPVKPEPVTPTPEVTPTETATATPSALPEEEAAPSPVAAEAEVTPTPAVTPTEATTAAPSALPEDAESAPEATPIAPTEVPPGALPEEENSPAPAVTPAETATAAPNTKPEEETAPAPAVSPTEAAAAALSALPEEEAMRLLVARLLREELRGDLGKQITRNVRKLVRSEILRVMETRKLD